MPPMVSIFTIAAYWSWLLLCLVWLPGSFKSKKTARVPEMALQVPTSIVLALGFILIFNPDVFGLSSQLTQQTPLCGWIGLLLDFAGIGFAIWARLALRDNWSGLVMTVKEGHELVRNGPYAWVRHPIYLGLIVASVGTALTIGSIWSYLAIALIVVSLLVRIITEDRMMREHFREAHDEYASKTHRLFPYVW